MRVLLAITGIILALIAATFLPQVQELRDEKAYAAVEQGQFKRAKRFYAYGRFQGDVKSANNYHVLNFHMVRNKKGLSSKQHMANRRKSFRAFDKLTQKGFTPAAYNAGMFYYRTSRTEDRAKGLKYLEYAAASGDKMSRDAAGMLGTRGLKKEKHYQALRKAADTGNGLAAYRYVEALRFEPKKLKRAEKYALMGAQAGYADAQQFLGAYFPKRRDAKSWLEKAATNPDYRSVLAAWDLAKLADEKKDYVAKRRWLTLGSSPREKFGYRILIQPEGLRWRRLQNTILADVNNSKKAAYELALMQLDGIGGALDFDAAKVNLKYADDWADAAGLLARIYSGVFDSSKPLRSQRAKDQDRADLEQFDKQKHFKFHSKLRPLMVSKKIRYATQSDLDKFSKGVSTTFSNEKSGFQKRGGTGKCALGKTCFYMEKATIFPPDMFGSKSASFLINPAQYLPKQNRSHNRYIFMSERHIP